MIRAMAAGRSKWIVPVEEALDEIRAGRMVILMDDEDRETEGDLCVAAERVTGRTLGECSEAERRTVFPALLDTLDADAAPSIITHYLDLTRAGTPVGRSDHLDARWTDIGTHEQLAEARQMYTASGPAD